MRHRETVSKSRYYTDAGLAVGRVEISGGPCDGATAISLEDTSSEDAGVLLMMSPAMARKVADILIAFAEITEDECYGI